MESHRHDGHLCWWDHRACGWVCPRETVVTPRAASDRAGFTGAGPVTGSAHARQRPAAAPGRP
ncbi:MAG TPA: hypothetical protein VFL99_01845 [Segeticoccus sp.]|uniref:hypothetical protein n=1 Tax=Segeticoccus sp. TaxID=2706531 RepID=UPI002D80C0FE|nr:hypothetical protein [Segeticoccus sp.]HET8599038.1 hypothetical protein [Segeticoccus sp.]